MTGPVTGATTARARVADPTGAERARLARGLGMLLTAERTGRGWSFADVAGRAGCHESTVRRLEAGIVRPSETLLRALAEALRPDGSPVDVAVLDLRLQRAAGDSVRRWRRTRPLSARRTRTYARAAELLEAARPDPGGDVVVGLVLAALDGVEVDDGT